MDAEILLFRSEFLLFSMENALILHPAVALPNKKDYTNLIDRRIQKLYRKDGWLL